MTIEHDTRTTEELIAELPQSLQLQVRDFVEFLLNKHHQEQRQKRLKLRQGPTSKPDVVEFPQGATVMKPKKQDKLRQDWANAINYQDHTSVELQHLAQSWREQ